MGFARKKVLSFFVDEKCNMSCIYCTVQSDLRKSKTDPKVIDVNFAKLGIDDYFGNGFFKEGEKKGLRIFGNGEPTMEFDIIREIIEYGEMKAGEELFVEMQSNGYFTAEIARWLGEHVDLLWFSLDGVGEVQNRQRPTRDGKPSFPVIDRNVKIIARSDRTKMGFRPTISIYNIDRQEELIDYARDNGVLAIHADPWGHFLGKVEGQARLIDFAKRLIESWRYADSRGVQYGSEFIVNFDEEVEIYCRSCLPAPEFTPDGYVTCCDMACDADSFMAKAFPAVLFGKYNKEENRIDYDQEKIEKIRSRNIYNLKDCQGCMALKHCAGGCIGSGMVYSGDFYGVNKEYCAVVKYLYKKMPELINVGYDENVLIHP